MFNKNQEQEKGEIGEVEAYYNSLTRLVYNNMIRDGNVRVLYKVAVLFPESMRRGETEHLSSLRQVKLAVDDRGAARLSLVKPLQSFVPRVQIPCQHPEHPAKHKNLRNGRSPKITKLTLWPPSSAAEPIDFADYRKWLVQHCSSSSF